MKKRGFKINLEDDSLEIKGRRIDLDTTEKGHHKIPLGSIEDVNIANIEKKSVEEKQKILEKLQRQFYHPSEKSFKNLMMNAGEYDIEVKSIIENISNNCEFC